MKSVLLALISILVLSSESRATWSVIAVDTSTGQIAIASATCVPQALFARFPAKGLKDVQAIILPGVGVAAAQASVDRTRGLQLFLAEEMRRGKPPDQIIEMLKERDPDHELRQYAIVDLRGRSAGYSGSRNGRHSLDRQGRVEGTGIHFSIQGNILAGDQVVEDAVRAFQSASGTLPDRVMAAMEAADKSGGDRRCTCDTLPDPPAPCSSKTSHVAYLVVANTGDASGAGLNDGTYNLEIDVNDRNISADEDDNPVRTLRLRYDQRMRSSN